MTVQVVWMGCLLWALNGQRNLGIRLETRRIETQLLCDSAALSPFPFP